MAVAAQSADSFADHAEVLLGPSERALGDAVLTSEALDVGGRDRPVCEDREQPFLDCGCARRRPPRVPRASSSVTSAIARRDEQRVPAGVAVVEHDVVGVEPVAQGARVGGEVALGRRSARRRGPCARGRG